MTTVTVPDLEYLTEKGIDFESEPADWFNIYLPKNRVKGTHPKAVTMDELTSWTNTKAMISNAGKRGVHICMVLYWTDRGPSHLHSRVTSLFSQLPDEKYACRMDNLYMSAKFAKVAAIDRKKHPYPWNHSARPWDPDMPYARSCDKKEYILFTRGTMKAAILVGDFSCPSLGAASLYNSKPVYLVGNACNIVRWIKKDRKLRHKDKGKKVNVLLPFEYDRPV